MIPLSSAVWITSAYQSSSLTSAKDDLYLTVSSLALLTAIAISSARVMELSGLNFMDSTGIGVLLGRYKKLSNLGIPILIANPNKSVDKILTLSGIYKIMPKIATEA